MYLNPQKTESGAYPPPQNSPANGLLYFPENFMGAFYAEGKVYSGFVDIETDGSSVLTCVWNEAAYEAYINSLPEPEPEKTVWDELDAAYREGVNAV